jgi:hypothetical protein
MAPSGITKKSGKRDKPNRGKQVGDDMKKNALPPEIADLAVDRNQELCDTIVLFSLRCKDHYVRSLSLTDCFRVEATDI